jgi:electron transfer flavoprotein alpha/beta subunit
LDHIPTLPYNITKTTNAEFEEQKSREEREAYLKMLKKKERKRLQKFEKRGRKQANEFLAKLQKQVSLSAELMVL